MPWMLIIYIVLMVVSYLLTPKPKQPDAPTPGDVTETVVDASSAVPVLFGTRMMAQPNCAWYGDIGTTPIMRSSGGK